MSLKVKLLPESFKLEFSQDKYNLDFDKADGELRIVGCKNSFAAFQLAVCCDEPYIINTGKTDYLSQKGSMKKYRISIDAPHAFAMNIEDMHTDDDLAKRADALLSFEAFECEENSVHAIWCEAKFPKKRKSRCVPRNYTHKRKHKAFR